MAAMSYSGTFGVHMLPHHPIWDRLTASDYLRAGEAAAAGDLHSLWFASRFLARPQSFTDFHTADIAPYARRFEIELCATGVIDEQQLLSLFEDSITLAQGPHVGRPGPVRSDLRVDRDALAPRRAEA